MNSLEQYSCICGASGDKYDLTGHVIEKFAMPEDTNDHAIIGIDEPAVITEARERWKRITVIQQQLMETFDAPLSEIRAALLG